MLHHLFDVSTRLGLAVVTAVVSTVVSFFFWGLLSAWQVRRIKARIRKYASSAGRSADGGMALVLSVARDVEEDVRRHLDADEATRGIPLLKVHQEGGLELREEVWLHYLERVKKEWRRIAQSGVPRVYLFINAPVAMGVYVGAILLPGPEVVLHHYQENAYHRAGSLTTVAKL
jgi:alkanesulfonate monooxygenase SsuD/methylene tetrahydromethanopterin reductase-like flavin-dependent oxidoreductase (luciferase family)